MPLSPITVPATEPVTLDQAKAYLKVDTSDDDALITSLIVTARTRVEWHVKRALITQTWILWEDGWPASGVLEIPLPPLQAVTAIATYAPDDTAATLDSSLYQIDAVSMPARAVLKPDTQLPNSLRQLNSVGVAFRAGYGDAASDVPAPLCTAILQIVACQYESRGDVAVELPAETLALLQPYRMIDL